MKNLSIYLSILNKREKLNFIFVLSLSFIAVIFELLGLGMIIPIFSIFIDLDNFRVSLLYNYIDQNVFNLNQLSNNFIIYLIISLTIIFFFFRATFLTIHHIFFMNFVYDLRLNLSSRLFKRYLLQPAKFFIDNPSPKLIRNIQTEIAEYVHTFIYSLLNLFTAIFVCSGIAILLMFENPKLFLLLSSIISIIFTIYWLYIKKILVNIGKNRHTSEEKKTKELINSLNAYKEIKIYNAGEFFHNKFYEFFKTNLQAVKQYSILQRIPYFIVEFLFILIILFFLFIVVIRKYDLLVFLPSLGLYLAATIRILPNILKINENFQNISYSSISVNYIINEFNKTKNNNEICNIDSNINQLIGIEKIEFRNVDFEYEKNIKIFKNLNISFFKGKTFGIIGDSGKGKSTLLNLISNLYEPTSGKIHYSNNQVEIEKKLLKNQIGYVSQDNFIYDDNVLNNILFGMGNNKTLTKKIKSFLIQTKLSKKFIKNGKLTSSSLGEKGNVISDGQKQRVAISRALLRNPSIYIFDEATNALDKENQREIIKIIDQIKLDSIVIVVSHDPKVIEKCDYVYKINKKKLYKV